jgi:hypothetical protein
MARSMSNVETFSMESFYMVRPDVSCVMCNIDIMTQTSMAAVSEIAQQGCHQQEEQSKEKAAYKEQGKWISCHNYAPLA